MAKYSKIIIIALVILLGAIFQVLFCLQQNRETPNKAAIEFAKAYFRFDCSTMNDRLCNAQKTDVNPVEQYIQHIMNESKERGFRLSYLKSKLYHVETDTISKSESEVLIRLTCGRKSPLRAFFSGDTYDKVDETIKLIKEDGKWKVCSGNFLTSKI